MSDTPKVDVAETQAGYLPLETWVVKSEFARTLEIELNKWKYWHEQTRIGGQVLAQERDHE